MDLHWPVHWLRFFISFCCVLECPPRPAVVRLVILWLFNIRMVSSKPPTTGQPPSFWQPSVIRYTLLETDVDCPFASEGSEKIQNSDHIEMRLEYLNIISTSTEVVRCLKRFETWSETNNNLNGKSKLIYFVGKVTHVLVKNIVSVQSRTYNLRKSKISNSWTIQARTFWRSKLLSLVRPKS